jgi:cell division protein FtsI (penicillin-binding protein 3)
MLERRLKWLAGLILIWGGLILCKVVSLQVVHHGQYAGLARARQEQVITILAARGAIFDRTGAPLAMSVPTQSIYLNPQKVPDLGVAADILAMVLTMDRADLYARLEAAREGGRGYFMVKKKAAWEEAQRLRGMGFDWIEIESGSERHYPNGALAGHILGGVDFAEKGNSGIERVLEADLEGAPGEERVLTDVRGRGIDALVESEPKPGAALTLTIDERVQFVAERELASAAREKGAHSGSVVVMNPHNGEILALASYPPYDPNQPPVAADNPEARLNHAASVPFEPGSVFKVVTLAAALETTKLRPESMIDCGRGSITLFGRTIHEAHGGYGVMSMADVLKHSSNVGAIRIGMTVGEANGCTNTCAASGSARGPACRCRRNRAAGCAALDRWSKLSLPSISIGQEVSVTALQLAQAASIVANGGLLVRPRLVLKKGGQAVAARRPCEPSQPETAMTMRQMMEGVVLPGGTGYPEARLAGYSAAGKTGSAQIYDVAATDTTRITTTAPSSASRR